MDAAPKANALETIAPAQPKPTPSQLQPSATVDMLMFTSTLSKILGLRQQAGAGVQAQLGPDLSATCDSSTFGGMLSKILTSEVEIGSGNNTAFATPSPFGWVAKEQSEPRQWQQQALQQPRLHNAVAVFRTNTSWRKQIKGRSRSDWRSPKAEAFQTARNRTSTKSSIKLRNKT